MSINSKYIFGKSCSLRLWQEKTGCWDVVTHFWQLICNLQFEVRQKLREIPTYTLKHSLITCQESKTKIKWTASTDYSIHNYKSTFLEGR